MKNVINAKNLIWLAVFSAPLYFMNFYLFGIPTNVPEVLIMFAFIIWLTENKNFNWKNFYSRHKKFLAGIFLIFLGLVISTLINPNHLAEWGIIKSWFIIPWILSFILLNEIRGEKDVERIFKALYFSAATAGLIGLIYFFRGELTYDLRLKAFFLSPNYLAMFLSPAVFIGNYFIISCIKRIIKITHDKKKRADSPSEPTPYLLWNKNSLKNKTFLLSVKTLIFLFLIQLIIISALYLTYSYAAWTAIILSLIASSLIAQDIKMTKKIKISIVLMALFLAILSTQLNNSKFTKSFDWQAESRSSLASRLMIWQSAEKILESNFLWGIGPGNFQSEYLKYQKYFPPYLEWAVPQPHNLYLAFWLQSGILGLAGFLYLVFNWIKGIIKIIVTNTLSKKGFKKIAPVLLGIMLYILLHGIADTPYWKNDLAIIFWTVFSLGTASISFNEKIKLKTSPSSACR